MQPLQYAGSEPVRLNTSVETDRFKVFVITHQPTDGVLCLVAFRDIRVLQMLRIDNGLPEDSPPKVLVDIESVLLDWSFK